jgi:hypothetical protein
MKMVTGYLRAFFILTRFAKRSLRCLVCGPPLQLHGNKVAFLSILRDTPLERNVNDDVRPNPNPVPKHAFLIFLVEHGIFRPHALRQPPAQLLKQRALFDSGHCGRERRKRGMSLSSRLLTRSCLFTSIVHVGRIFGIWPYFLFNGCLKAIRLRSPLTLAKSCPCYGQKLSFLRKSNNVRQLAH